MAKQKKEIFDFAILGGCITSVTLGYLLQKAGKKVLLVEQQSIGIETTGRYYTILSEQPEFIKINNYKPPASDPARTPFDYLQKGLEFILATSKKYNIRCDLRHVPDRALPFAGQQIPGPVHLFNPFKYIIALADVVRKNGGAVMEKSRVLKVEQHKDTYTVHTSRGKAVVKNVIYSPRSSRILSLGLKLVIPYQTYSLMAKLANIYPESVFRNTKHNLLTHIIQVDRNTTLVEVQGADYKVIKGKDDRRQFKILEDYLLTNFEVQCLMVRWSSVYYKSPDGGLLTGPLETPGSYVVAGYNYSYPSIGTMAAMYFTQQLFEKESLQATGPAATNMQV